MIPGGQGGRNQLGGKIGEEIRRIWKALGRDQIISRPAQRVSHTPSGTLVENKAAGGSVEVNPKPIHFAEYTGDLEEPVHPYLDDCTIDGGTEKHSILLPCVDLDQILHAARVFIEPWKFGGWDSAGNPLYEDPDGQKTMIPPPFVPYSSRPDQLTQHGIYSTLEVLVGQYFPREPRWGFSYVYDYQVDDNTIEGKRFKWRWSDKFTESTGFWLMKLPEPILDYEEDGITIHYVAVGASKWAPAQEVSI